jgi:hypothetical protein
MPTSAIQREASEETWALWPKHWPRLLLMVRSEMAHVRLAAGISQLLRPARLLCSSLAPRPPPPKLRSSSHPPSIFSQCSCCPRSKTRGPASGSSHSVEFCQAHITLLSRSSNGTYSASTPHPTPRRPNPPQEPHCLRAFHSLSSHTQHSLPSAWCTALHFPSSARLPLLLYQKPTALFTRA